MNEKTFNYITISNNPTNTKLKNVYEIEKNKKHVYLFSSDLFSRQKTFATVANNEPPSV